MYSLGVELKVVLVIGELYIYLFLSNFVTEKKTRETKKH